MGGSAHSMSGSFIGGKITGVPYLDSKSLPTKVLGIQVCIKIHESLGVPSPGIFRVGLRHKGCIYHHLRPTSLWSYWRIKSIGKVFRRTQRVIRFPLESL